MNENTETEVSTHSELHNFIDYAQAGERCCYHRGHLSYDRDKNTKSLGDGDRIRLGELADLALVAAESGLVTLIQRREGEEVWAYIAVRTNKRVRPKHVDENQDLEA
jgi:hypothetical protein